MHDIAERPLAIVGMACRMPGADNLDEFWQLLVEGRSQLGELPPDRLNRELHYDPRKGIRTRSYSTLGGVVPAREFDRDACPIPQELIDRSHQVHLNLCEVAASACRHAGLDPFHLPPMEVGVYIGHTPPSSLAGNIIYARQIEQTAQYLREIPGFDELTGGAQDAVIREIVAEVRGRFSEDDPRLRIRANAYHAAAVITEGFGLHGPAMCFDAACASSLRALSQAARALQVGQIDMAIVGGASYCHADTLVLFSQAQSVSAKRGTCPFDNDADGLVASEGYVVVVLKTLEQALADGDPIQAVIRRIGISSDGKGKSLWAPRAEGQVEAIHRSYDDEISLADLGYIEMHATSTQVGDATEIDALSRALDGVFPDGKKIPVGSVKANVGHTLEAAGLASLIKTVLAVQHQTIPRQINIDKLNEKIDWDAVPFFVPLSNLPWPAPEAGTPRRAAVNAFGIGGLNVHVVLDEHVAEASRALVSQPTAGRPNDKANGRGEHESIAVIGMGTVMPGARTIDAFWDMIRSGGDQKTAVPPQRWDPQYGFEADSNRLWRVPTRMGGFITDFEYDWKRHKVPPKQVASADPLQFMLLDAVDQALHNAGLDEKPFDKTRTGVMVGTIFCGEFTDHLQMGLHLCDFRVTLRDVLRRRGVRDEEIEQVADQYEDILLKHMPALIDETGSFTASTLASRITKTFNLMGGATAIDSGDTSAMSVLSASIDILRAGDCDMMLCAAGHRAMGLASYESMAKTGLLSQTYDPKGPFDDRATGQVPGEGVGVVILKRLSDARRDGDRIQAVIRGIGVARDESLSRGVCQAATRSLENAGVTPDEVAVVEAGSTGIPQNDKSELSGLAEAYVASGKRSDLLRIGALAGQVGGTGGASGMLELLKAIAELNHAEIPKNVGPARPAGYVGDHTKTLRLAEESAPVRIVNSDCHGLAGISSYSQYKVAYHLLVEGGTKIPRSPNVGWAVPTDEMRSVECGVRNEEGSIPHSAFRTPHSETNWRIVRIAAESLSGLAEEATKRLPDAAQLFERADTAFEKSVKFRPGDRCRLAIVAESADDLSAKLKLAGGQLQHPPARPLLAEKGIFFGTTEATRPKVGFLFPGQGSQYDGMLRSLVEEYAPAADALQDVDAVLARLELPSFAELAWNEAGGLGTDVWRTQLSLLAADTIVYAATYAMGIRPDRVAGHSFGELAALTAAGSWTFDEAIRATHARCAAIDACQGDNGMMVSTSAPADVVESLCKEISGRVSVSHRNAPEQTVAGGDDAAVRQLADLVRQQGYKTKILDVPAAFHTPLMEDVKEPFGRALGQIQVDPPRIPLLSSVTNRYVADPDDIRENLVVQMTQPVDWCGLALRLADDGVSVFVEVGPRQVLTGLNKQILADRDLAFVGSDHPKRGGLQQLLYARACVEVTSALDAKSEPTVVRVSDEPIASSDHKATISPTAETQDASADTGRVPKYDGLKILRLSGSAYDIGFQHGQTQQQEIRVILRRYADLAGSSWEKLFNLDEAVRQPEIYFGADELEELRGIAKGADVTLANVVAHNLRLFYDAGAGGIHFALSAQANPHSGLLHAINEDLTKSVRLDDCLARNIQVRRPDGGLPYITFGVAGQIGSLSGINSRGLTVSASTLADVPRDSVSQQGKLSTVLVKQILEEAVDIDSAVEIVHGFQEDAGGTWGLCLSRHEEDRVCYVEWDGTNLKVQPSMPSVLAANHRLLMNFYDTDREIPLHSDHRLNRLKELLGGEQPTRISAKQAQDILRDRFDPSRGRPAQSPTINTICRIDNQISIVMQPAAGNLWVTGGPLANGQKDQFSRLDLRELLPELTPTQNPVDGNGAGAHKGKSSIVPAEEIANGYAEAAANGQQRVCSRFVMRVIEAPLAAGIGQEPLLAGPALIVGDNPAARALKLRLEQTGTQVEMLPVGKDAEQTLSDFERIWESCQPLQLFLMTPHDKDAVTSLNSGDWNRRRTRGVMIPYFVCQKWYGLVASAKSLDRALLVAATTMGGDFGFSGKLNNVESGALAGLLKGVAMETKMQVREERFRTKIVDTAATIAPSDLADCLCQELAASDEEIEIGYIDRRRYLPRPLAEPIEEHRRSDIPREATFIITGGARGVTALVARELGQRYGLKLHLIGSSPKPDVPIAYLDLSDAELKDLRATVMKEALGNGEKPLDVWGRFEKSLEIACTLKSFADSGIRATYHSCDISDRGALSALLDQIRAADGPIEGIIHGAGFERACRFEKKQRELVDRTIAAKVDGAAVLMELTRDDPLRYLAAFGSVSGRQGGVGQTDYCLANEMLAKLIGWFRQQRKDCGTAVFHWHAWDDVGMAVRPESKHIAKLHNIVFMPSREGTDHLLDELCAGLPEAEIVVTELAYCQKTYAGVPKAAQTSGPPTLSTLPLVDAHSEFIPGERLTGELRLDPTSDVFLCQHRYKGRPMLPVVISLESLAEAASLLVGEQGRIVALSNIEILNGLRFLSDDPLTARLKAQVGDDGIHCELSADFVNRRGQVLKADQPYLRCLAEVADELTPPKVSLPEPSEPWIDTWYPEDDKVIYHGPIFRTFRQFVMQDHDAWSRLVAPEAQQVGGARQGDGWVLPPALLDGCFFASGVFLWCLIPGCVSIPAGIERLSIGRPPRTGEICTLHIHFRGREAGGGIFDFTLAGDDQAMILKVDGYQNIIVYEIPEHASKS